MSPRNRFVMHRARLLALVGLVSLLPVAPSGHAQTPRALPDRISDSAFWTLQGDISEPDAYFRIEDNYTSNEIEIGQLFTLLRNGHISGGVYMGVGPEQNLTYIAAIRPKMAFIVDIRRQAAMQHLMFKALFEMSKDRAEFISQLFSKPRPAGLDSTTTIQKMWDAFYAVRTDSVLGNRTWTRIIERLTKTHGFTFTADESNKLKAVYDAFYYFGPAITTRGSNSGRGGSNTLVDLTGYSTDAMGVAQSFLSTEENYQYVKSLHERNLIVPVTGDFGGVKAVRAVGAWLKDHGGVVSAFYVSNVEQYLFQDGKANAFYENVGTLPIDSTSVFIRPYSMRRGSAGVTRSLCPIATFLQAVRAGHVYSNNEALACG